MLIQSTSTLFLAAGAARSPAIRQDSAASTASAVDTVRISGAAREALAASVASAGAPAEMSAAVEHPDFTSMTRQEMFDWMNGQIRAGKMSLDESSPFLGMTVKISVATGQAVDMATDDTRIDFIERARLGIEAAMSRNDPDSAGRLRAAMEIMRRQ
jgi:hypothetical protein